MFVYNHLNRPRNRQMAQEAAAKIVAYQQQYPGRPVHLVGYSGGGTMAVMTLEALPPGVQVTNAVVIGSTMSMNYDLRTAMSHSQQGIHNFYSYLDVPMLEGFCLLTGTGDGRYTLSSGMVGFVPPRSLSAVEREAYAQGLHQQPFEPRMLKDGHWGGHFGWIGPVVLERHIAPLLNTPTQRLPAALADTAAPQQQTATLLRVSAIEEAKSK
jgi:pimeloyl-ACP methyl ester carboxylesterase